MPGGYKERQMAIEEGAIYHFLTQPVRFIANSDGHLSQIERVRTKLGEPDDSSRHSFSLIDGSDFIMDADTAILAIGYKPDPIIGSTTPGVKTNQGGLLKANITLGKRTVGEFLQAEMLLQNHISWSPPWWQEEKQQKPSIATLAGKENLRVHAKAVRRPAGVDHDGSTDLPNRH